MSLYMNGIVTSDVNNKTITVKVCKKKFNSLYKKIVVVSKKYLVHDEDNFYKKGDFVSIVSCRPISAKKKWKVFIKV